MYINCVYYGHRYGPQDEVPCSMADVLKEHIAHCPEHPLAELLELCKATDRIIDYLFDLGLSFPDKYLRTLQGRIKKAIQKAEGKDK